MQNSCNPVFPGRQVRLASTARPIILFGGLVSLIIFFERIGLAAQISGLMPFTYSSPNSIPPAQTLVAFMISVVAGVVSSPSKERPKRKATISRKSSTKVATTASAAFWERTKRPVQPG